MESTDGRTLGTHWVDAWESNYPSDALADAAEADDLVAFFTEAMKATCEDPEDPKSLFTGAGLASVVAAVYAGVDVGVPSAREFIDTHELQVDTALRQLTLDAVECARSELLSDDTYFGELTGDVVAELDVVTNLLNGPRGS